MNAEKQKTQRTFYFDVLRILATIAIIFIHCSPYPIDNYRSTAFGWKVIYCCISRWGVPIFVMISGALFLSAKSSIKKIYKKNILRIATSLIFWSVLYAVIREICFGYGKINMVIESLYGHYHMWFLFMILGLYMLVPFFRKIVESESLMKYFLILSFIWSVAIPQLVSLLSLISSVSSDILNTFASKFRLNFSLSFLFVYGYFLNRKEISKTCRKRIYIIGSLALVMMIIGTLFVSIKTNENNEILQGYMSILALCFSTGVFVFFKYTSFDNIGEKVSHIISMLSKYSFCAYLIHPLVIELSILWGWKFSK